MSQYEPSRPYQQSPPYPPYAPYQPPPPWEGPPPEAVRYARNLIYALLVVSAVRVAVWTLGDDHGEVPEQFAGRGADDAITAALAAISVMSSLMGAAVWIVAAIFIMRAANWARILVLGLCAWTAIGLIWAILSAGFIDPGNRPATELIVLDVVAVVFIAAATVLLWIPSSSRFFKSSYPS